MSLSNKKKTQSTSDIFNDDFEVIYEGDLPDISIDDDDDYRDVLSGLSDIDHTDYIKKNDYDRLTKKLKNKNKKAGKKNKKQSKKDNFFDTAYYDDDIFDELDDDLYDDEYEDDYDNEYEDDYDDPRNNRQKEKKSRKNRSVKVPNVAKPVAKTAKAGGKILFKFINLQAEYQHCERVANVVCLRILQSGVWLLFLRPEQQKRTSRRADRMNRKAHSSRRRHCAF